MCVLFARILTASFMLLWTCSQAVTGDRRRTFRPVGKEKRGEGRGESSLLERVETAGRRASPFAEYPYRLPAHRVKAHCLVGR